MDRFLKRCESSVSPEIAMEPHMVNDLFKSKGSVANCMMDRASVHTGNASEQFLYCNLTLILVHTVPKQLLKRSKNPFSTV